MGSFKSPPRGLRKQVFNGRESWAEAEAIAKVLSQESAWDASEISKGQCGWRPKGAQESQVGCEVRAVMGPDCVASGHWLLF